MAEEKKKFEFFVDDRRFEVTTPSITGAEIRRLAGLAGNVGLFLEEHGHDKPDQEIKNDTTVNLAEPGVEKFYSVPAATFGMIS